VVLLSIVDTALGLDLNMEFRLFNLIHPARHLFKRVPIVFKKLEYAVLGQTNFTFPFKSIEVKVSVKYLVLLIV
jgi:hypothetical protein